MANAFIYVREMQFNISAFIELIRADILYMQIALSVICSQKLYLLKLEDRKHVKFHSIQ